jgi:two-component system LytT family response regulator
MIRALIVDDEPIARNGLRALLAGDRDVQIVGECGNGVVAVQAIQRERPDLVFLDVQMPDLDGFGVLDQLEPGEMPAIVFVTAYDQYAIRAFEVNALDYLVKPFDRDRFRDSLARAKRQIRQGSLSDLNDKMHSLLQRLGASSAAGARRPRTDRILVKDRSRVSFVRPSEIDWIEVQENYLCLHVGAERHLTRDTLTAMLERLDPTVFLRISRSRALNVEKVKDGTKLESSRRQRGVVEDHFDLA